MLASATSLLQGDGVIHFYLFLFLLFILLFSPIFLAYEALQRHEENHLATPGLSNQGAGTRCLSE